jgi:hypothetical protein
LTHLSSLAILPPIEEAPMSLLSLPAVFMRGGTSRAVMFHARDLPDRAEWDPLFLAAMGSPDPNGRQLNGMGGGISSLSTVCILAPSDRCRHRLHFRPGADPRSARRLSQQLRQHEFGRRTVCGG